MASIAMSLESKVSKSRSDVTGSSSTCRNACRMAASDWRRESRAWVSPRSPHSNPASRSRGQRAGRHSERDRPATAGLSGSTRQAPCRSRDRRPKPPSNVKLHAPNAGSALFPALEDRFYALFTRQALRWRPRTPIPRPFSGWVHDRASACPVANTGRGGTSCGNYSTRFAPWFRAFCRAGARTPRRPEARHRLAAPGARSGRLVVGQDGRPHVGWYFDRSRRIPRMKGPMALTAELVARCERKEPIPDPIRATDISPMRSTRRRPDGLDRTGAARVRFGSSPTAR